jgi:hypothetical protein
MNVHTSGRRRHTKQKDHPPQYERRAHPRPIIFQKQELWKNVGACCQNDVETRQFCDYSERGVSCGNGVIRLPCPPDVADGIVTISPCFVAVGPCGGFETEYRVDFPVPLSLTQNGLVAVETSPRPLIKSRSAGFCALPVFDTRSVRTYCAKLKDGSRKIKKPTSANGFKTLTADLISSSITELGLVPLLWRLEIRKKIPNRDNISKLETKTTAAFG